MKTIEISQTGGPEVLTLKEIPTPPPGAGQVLVRVQASSTKLKPRGPSLLVQCNMECHSYRMGTFLTVESSIPLPIVKILGGQDATVER